MSLCVLLFLAILCINHKRLQMCPLQQSHKIIRSVQVHRFAIRFKMAGFTTKFILIVFSICSLGLFQLSVSQISTHPVVIGRLGSPAVLTCHSNGVPLRLCLWEQKDSDLLIATFDLSSYKENGKPYSYHGEGLEKGTCGLKIKTVVETDLQRWKCTLLGRDNSTAVFRGSVYLQGAETLESEPSDFSLNSGSNGTATGSSTHKPPLRQESRNFHSASGAGAMRPIVTAEYSVSSASAPVAPNTVPVQEVEVQSAGLVIVPRRKDRKLVIL